MEKIILEKKYKHWELLYGLRNFSCNCKFNMDIRGRCIPFQLTGIEKDSEYYSYKLFIDNTYKTCPYKLKSAQFYIQNDTHSIQTSFDNEDELRSFISSYEELFSLNEIEMDTLYKMIILDSNDNSFSYESMDEVDSVYQKYISCKKKSPIKKKIYRLKKKSL